MIEVLIADDHHLFREGMAYMLNEQADIRVIGMVENGDLAVKESLALQPDIVLMDAQMPIVNGIFATKELLRQNQSMKVIMLIEDEDHIQLAHNAGASEYVFKSDSATDLFKAIRKVYQTSPQTSNVRKK